MRNWIVIFVICCVGAAAIWGWKQLQPPPQIEADRLVKPRRGPIVRGVIAVGRVEPRTRVDLKSKANGIIRKLLVDVADRIEEGQVIVELDKEILQARVAEAEGRLEQARGVLEAAKASLAKAQVERSDPEIIFAANNWERARMLYAEGIVSDEERDAAKDRHDKAQYRVKLLEAEIGVASASVVAASGRLKEVEALAELARQELAEATIRSPVTGVVLHRYLEEGDSVSSIRSAGGNATIVMTLGDLSELYVDGEVDEVDVGKIISEQRIRPDLEARVSIESFKDRIFPGRVTRIAPLGLEDRNGIVTFEVRIVLENPEKLLLANMTANSQIVLEEKTDVLLLSQGALLSDGSARYAQVYDPKTGRQERREIQTGISDGRVVEITSGLNEDQVVLVP